jgi:hypothetical protein
MQARKRSRAACAKFRHHWVILFLIEISGHNLLSKATPVRLTHGEIKTQIRCFGADFGPLIGVPLRSRNDDGRAFASSLHSRGV